MFSAYMTINLTIINSKEVLILHKKNHFYSYFYSSFSYYSNPITIPLSMIYLSKRNLSTIIYMELKHVKLMTRFKSDAALQDRGFSHR